MNINIELDAVDFTPEEVKYMADVVMQRYLSADAAGEIVGIKGNNLRMTIRRGADGTQGITPLKVGRQELFLDTEVNAFHEYRQELKNNRELAKSKRKTRSTTLLNLNMLRTLAQHLEVEGFSRMDRDSLLAGVNEQIKSHVTDPDSIDLNGMNFIELMSLVTDIVKARQASESDVDAGAEDVDEGYDVDDLPDA